MYFEFKNYIKWIYDSIKLSAQIQSIQIILNWIFFKGIAFHHLFLLHKNSTDTQKNSELL